MSISQYPRYTATGVEWMPTIPDHWGVERLKACARLRTDKATERTNAVGLENVESWTGRFLPSETEFSGDGIGFSTDDLLFGKLRPYLAKVLIAPFDGEAVGDFLVLSPADKMVARFLQYRMLTREFIEIVDGSTFGSKMPRADWDFVGGMPVAVPPLCEQRAIVAFLDRETAKIGALVAEQERLMVLLREKRQAVITHAVTRGLSPDTPMKASGVDWLGEVPAHWRVMKIKWAARLESGHTPDKKVSAYWDGGDIPWVSLNDTGFLKSNDYITDTAYFTTEAGIANSSARLLPERCVVFSRDATIGRCAITTRPMTVSQHFIAWICGPHVVPEFLLQCLRSMTQELERLCTGATLKTIGLPDVKTLTVPVPPVDEQRSIVDHVGAVTSQLDDLIRGTESTLSLLAGRRMALISTAVTGQLDVRHLATSDTA